MELTIVKQKRKISCLVCRSKKIKCDGSQPCQVCVKRHCPDACQYPERRPLGRPAKNSVMNKLLRHRQHSSQPSLVKEFIFENLMYTIPTATARFLMNDKSLNMHQLIDNEFSETYCAAITNLSIARLSLSPNPFVPDVKMFDLLDTFSWTMTEVVNIFTSKITSLPLFNAEEYNFIAAAVYQDMCLKFLGEPILQPLDNPLSAISTDEAVRLIECFFSVDPQSILLNKTFVLQAFWSDQADPILLSVIYGTTQYFKKLLEGKPVRLWEASDPATRNPFLDYAYFLLLQSSSEVTFVKYQAVIILGLFENIYGYPKRGMALLSLAHMMGEKLGLHDGSLFASEISGVEAELACVCYWACIRNTVRGSVDVGQVAYYIDLEKVPLPPVNIDQSLSYQMEKSSGNLRLIKSYYYLVESYYACMVVSKYTYVLMQEFPDVKYNIMYPGKQQPRHFEKSVDGLLPRLAKALQSFSTFIKAHKHTWSPFQKYCIETAYHLLDIHVVLIKPFGQAEPGQNFANSVYDIFLTSSNAASSFTQAILNNDLTGATTTSILEYQVLVVIDLVIPKVYTLIDLLKTYLEHDHHPGFPPPRGTMIAVIDTATSILSLKHQRDPWDEQAIHALKSLDQLTQSPIWSDWSSIKEARERIGSYLSGGSPMPPLSTSSLSPSAPSQASMANVTSSQQWVPDLLSLLDPYFLSSALPLDSSPSAKPDASPPQSSHALFHEFSIPSNTFSF
ncbi:hypothetical protein DM01DRAFT_1410805, partial [Hesseltinella vesiculosa]